MRHLPALLVVALAAMTASVDAQNRQRAASAAAFLKEPGGLRLGSLVSGVTYPTGRSNSGHLETTVEGWMPAGSTAGSTRDGFDLSVIAGGGEAIRSAPNGSVIARVQEGTLLSRVGARGTWLRVRRIGWVARGSFGPAAEVATKPPEPKPNPTSPAPPPTTVAQVAPTPPPPLPPPPPPARPLPPASQPSPAPTSGPNNRPANPDASAPTIVSERATVRKGADLAASPDGGRLATLGETSDVEVLERRPGWIKVTVAGWVRETDVAADVASGPRITAAMIRERPDKFVGETVTWRLQYLAIQQADDLRPEMPRGQTYVLARGPLPESGFVYIMVDPTQAATFKTMAPLDEVLIEAVIRAGRTRYLPTPVLTLVALKGS